MSFIKCGDAENICVIEPNDLMDEETKKKLEALKDKMDKDQAILVAKEQE